MTDPDDPFAQWLAPRENDYLPPPPGSFDRVYRVARRRRRIRAAASCVAVAAFVGIAAVGVRHVVTTLPPPGTPVAPPAAPPTSLSPSPRTTTPAGPSRCADTQLQITVQGDPAGGGASQLLVYVIVTNVSAEACTISGYPRLTFADAAHRPVGSAFSIVDAHAPKPHLTLRPGASAHATVDEISVDVLPNCQPVAVAGYLVTPPSSTTATFVARPDHGCTTPGNSPKLNAPFVAGTGL